MGAKQNENLESNIMSCKVIGPDIQTAEGEDM